MIPQVYEYAFRGSASPLIDLYAPVLALKSTELYLGAALISAAILLVVTYRETRGLPPIAVLHWPLLPASLMLYAIYTLTWGHIDEVSINLEHASNLYHSGRFSFSPLRMLDGTVEYAYYLMLAPFGASARTLIVANYGLGLLIAWAHLWLLSRLVAGARVSTRLGLLLLFAVNYPLVAMLSNGFGNSLVSLGCLAALSLHFGGRPVWAAVLASALPLLRPDAVLYSYALLFAFMAAGRAGWSWPALVRFTWPVCALAGYLVLFRLAFGHWIPTPIAFKSVYPSMITLVALRSAVLSMPAEVSSPLQTLALIGVFASSAFKHDPRIAVTRRLLLPMTAVFFFYSLTRHLLGDFSGDAYTRYWIGFALTLFVCGFLVLARLATVLEASGWHSRCFGVLVPAAVIVLTANAIGWESARNYFRNRTDLGYAGQITASVIPDRLSVATSELSTFGLMLDREIVDLWGYTNPAIAQSRMLNGARIRSNPAFFLTARPELYFAYTPPADVADTERYLATFHHMRKDVNLLGDMNDVLAAYDVILIRHPQRSLFFLVRRDAVAEVQQSLASHGYVATAQRAIELLQFRAIYDRQVPTHFAF